MATTPTKAASSLGSQHPAEQDHLGQRQRDGAHHERQHGAHRQAFGLQRLDEGQHAGGVGVQRHPHPDGHHRGERVVRAGVAGEEVFGGPAVDERAEADPDQQVGPDLAEDGLDLLAAQRHPVGPGQRLAGRDLPAVQGGLEDERLHPAFDVQPAEDAPGDDGDEQPGRHVQGGDLEAEQAVEQDDGDLVDQRAGDQERQGHPDRHAGGDEADEGRHGRARAERGDDAEAGGGHVAHALAAAAEQGAGAFQGDVAAQDGDHEDDPGQQQRDLDGVVAEEVQPGPQPAARVQAGQVVDDRVPQRPVEPVHGQPGGRGQQQRGGPPGQCDDAARTRARRRRGRGAAELGDVAGRGWSCPPRSDPLAAAAGGADRGRAARRAAGPAHRRPGRSRSSGRAGSR